MAKYFITFVLLAFLVLENKSIYSRIHVSAHPSGESNSNIQFIRQQQQQLQLSQTHHHKHKQSQRPHHHSNQMKHHNLPLRQLQNGDTSDEADKTAALLRSNKRVQRHLQHQHEHQQHHQEHYQHQQHEQQQQQQQQQQQLLPSRLTLAKEIAKLRTLPRIWQQLQQTVDEHMFGDDAASTLSGGHEEVGDAEEHITDLMGPEIPLSVFDDTALTQKLIADGRIVDEQSNNKSSNVPLNASNEMAAIGGGSTTTAPMRCPKCESNRRVETISEEELTRLRIEFVKQQILEKLRLKERPNVSAIGLPKPIYEGTTIEHEEELKSKELDDYYARTSKKFIFLEKENRECQRIGASSSLCFSFKIDDADADGFDVSTAVLWIFKNKQNKQKQQNETLLVQQTIVVSEVQQQLDATYLPIVKTIAIQSIDVQDEWMKIDIEWPIKRWFGNHDLSHLIHISCESCDMHAMDEMISVDKDYRPFIMVDTQNRRRAPRQKRSINCTDGVTECCREKLYISFDEIGWGDWIIQPRGYDAYFCRGTCGSVASVTQSSSHHSTFLQKVLSTNRGNGRKPLELIPCCTAKQYSSLQLVFMDSNNTATQKTFPNMVVESCGCR